MMMRTRLAVLTQALALALALATPVAALAAKAPPKFGDYQSKGFLSDYSRIPTTDGTDGTFRYRDPNAQPGKYKKLLVDRVKIWFKEDSEYKGIDPDELKMLTDYFYQAIQKAAGDAYPMVSEPGPDVLRLRIAVTDLVPNQPAASVTTLVVPFLWVGEAGAGAAERGEVGATPFTGEATIELEAMDSQSSKQLAAYIETRVGKKYQWDQGVGAGVSSYMKAYSKWDYTKASMDHWAQLIRERLDEANGRGNGSAKK